MPTPSCCAINLWCLSAADAIFSERRFDFSSAGGIYELPDRWIWPDIRAGRRRKFGAHIGEIYEIVQPGRKFSQGFAPMKKIDGRIFRRIGSQWIGVGVLMLASFDVEAACEDSVTIQGREFFERVEGPCKKLNFIKNLILMCQLLNLKFRVLCCVVDVVRCTGSLQLSVIFIFSVNMRFSLSYERNVEKLKMYVFCVGR